MGAEARLPGCGPAVQLDQGHRELCLGKEQSPSFPEHTGHQICHTLHVPTLAALGWEEAQVGRLCPYKGSRKIPQAPSLVTQMF